MLTNRSPARLPIDRLPPAKLLSVFTVVFVLLVALAIIAAVGLTYGR